MTFDPSGLTPGPAGLPHLAQADNVAYEAELAFFFGRLNFERTPERAKSVADFRLDRMRELLQRLGNPQARIPCVHIAGSKGKGSVATLLARVLEDSALRIGLFTSPHVAEFGERMTVNGCLPSPAELVPLMRQLRVVAEHMDQASSQGRPTFFELTTALGWLHFAQAEVDFVVLEVGLGGRLDSTNICTPLVTVITSISYDHTRLLGETLAEIASEKAGIIKRCVPVVSGVLAPEAQPVIQQRARRTGAPLLELNTDFSVTDIVDTPQPHSPLPFPMFSAAGSCGDWQQVQLGMPGRHQTRNGCVALAVIAALRQSGMRIPESAVRSGLRRAVVPCRIEVLAQRPLLIVDAAHNVASVQAFCETLAGLNCGRRLVIFAASRDKDAAAMLRVLNTFADEVILTQFLNNPRAVEQPELERLAATCLTTAWTTAASPPAAIALARQHASPDDLIASTGSLFLAAEVREFILRQS